MNASARWNALLAVSKHGYESIVQLLLDKGVNVCSEDMKPDVVSTFSFTDLTQHHYLHRDFLSTMGLISLVVASLAALIGSFLTITTVNLEALNPWLETLGTRPMGPTPAPSPTAIATPAFWEAIPQHNLTLTFSDPFVSPETAPPTPPFAFVLEEEDDWESFTEALATEELFRQLGNLWLLVRRTVLVIVVNLNAFQWMHPYAGCDKQFEKPRDPHPWRVLPFGPLPSLAPVVAPPLPSPSLPSMHEWPASPLYPLAAFIERIRDLQNEVKDLKGEIEGLRRRQEIPQEHCVYERTVSSASSLWTILCLRFRKTKAKR